MDDRLKKLISDLKDEDLWSLYAYVLVTLKDRGLVRTRNITGERGEFLALKIYNDTPGLPNLQAAPKGTQNVDALSRQGERYSIKTISEPGKTTSAFYGLGEPGDKTKPERKFEYVIIVMVDKELKPYKIVELTWKQFLKLRKWHKTMHAWNLSITKNLLKEGRTL